MFIRFEQAILIQVSLQKGADALSYSSFEERSDPPH